jgi:hypothetical protein
MCAKAPPDDPLLFGAGRRPVRRRRWTVRVETAERRNSEDDQDLALITVRRDQLASVSQELAINVRIPTLSASGGFSSDWPRLSNVELPPDIGVGLNFHIRRCAPNRDAIAFSAPARLI